VRTQPEGSSRLLHTGGMIRLGTSADLADAASVYRRASLSNAGDRDNLLAHPEFLILGPEGLEEGRTHVAEQDGSLVGFATWAETAGIMELEDLFVDPGYRRRGIATALVSRRGSAGAGRRAPGGHCQSSRAGVLPRRRFRRLRRRKNGLRRRASHGTRDLLTAPAPSGGLCKTLPSLVSGPLSGMSRNLITRRIT
jgi:GNAT superfamily N-acetyltransferase